MPERRDRPHSDLLETWPRRREYLWMAIAAALALTLAVVGPIDLEAARVTEARVLEVEGALRASAAGFTDPFAGVPDELPAQPMITPLGCFPPRAQWILSYGDGRLPGEAWPDGTRPWRCVNADLRRKAHGPKRRRK